MEITGILVKQTAMREGVSKQNGNPWKIASYVIETIEAFPKRMVFDVSDGTAWRIERLGIKKDQVMRVWFEIDAHEKDGKWFNAIRAYDARVAG